VAAIARTLCGDGANARIEDRFAEAQRSRGHRSVSAPRLTTRSQRLEIRACVKSLVAAAPHAHLTTASVRVQRLAANAEEFARVRAVHPLTFFGAHSNRLIDESTLINVIEGRTPNQPEPSFWAER
jgi:hypothetical protein